MTYRGLFRLESVREREKLKLLSGARQCFINTQKKILYLRCKRNYMYKSLVFSGMSCLGSWPNRSDDLALSTFANPALGALKGTEFRTQSYSFAQNIASVWINRRKIELPFIARQSATGHFFRLIWRVSNLNMVAFICAMPSDCAVA
ncbi:hypothetical protein AB6A40_005145 [Gnathostoma spinigerum]|uniref:Uncharacterized protein n=1 Tax=Gnathostoma spinigerum TaxID=75299 RepID=A0ABD6EGU8_9BILA